MREDVIRRLSFYLDELHNYYIKTKNLNILNNLIKYHINLLKLVNENAIKENEIKILFERVENLLKSTQQELL